MLVHILLIFRFRAEHFLVFAFFLCVYVVMVVYTPMGFIYEKQGTCMGARTRQSDYIHVSQIVKGGNKVLLRMRKGQRGEFETDPTKGAH